MQGRGVMIDLHAHVGRERVVVGYDRLMRVIEADKVAVEEGDMVCLHTGFGALLLEARRRARPRGRQQRLRGARRPRRTASCSGSPTQGSPASSPTTTPSRPIRRSPARAAARRCRCTSTACSSLGVNLGELWHLTPLADWLRANGRYRFLLTAPPLRLTGAVGSPATPVATV